MNDFFQKREHETEARRRSTERNQINVAVHTEASPVEVIHTEADSTKAISTETAPAETVHVEAEPAEVSPPEAANHTVIGVVTDCMKLNVHKEASVDAEVLAVIDCLSKVMVDMDASTNDFYKICIAAGVEGFCMKKYIAVRK